MPAPAPTPALPRRGLPGYARSGAPRGGATAEGTKRKAQGAASGGNGGSGKAPRREIATGRGAGGDNGSDDDDNDSDAALSVVFRTFATALARKRKRPGKHRSALRGTFRFGFAGVPNAPNIELGLFKHKERARESPLGFSQAPIEQTKRNKPPLRNRLGSLAAVGLVLARSLCSILMAALHLARSNAALGRVRTVQNVPFSVRKGQCTVTVRKHLPKRCTI